MSVLDPIIIRVCARIIMATLAALQAECSAPTVTVSSSDTSYRNGILQKYFRGLVPPGMFFDLPGHYFAVRNPFDVNGTQYRFNLTNGKLRVNTPNLTTFDGKACKVLFSPTRAVHCIFSIDGSTANYSVALYYGRPINQTFQVLLTAEAYTYENSGWNNPIDIYVHLKPKHISGKTYLAATSVFATEFVVQVTVHPEFHNFSVFQGNSTIITNVYGKFWDYMYRKGRPDMRNVAKDSYYKQIAENAKLTPIDESLFWKL
ncbi:uncharacterized protein LOC142817378 isoform X2 [Rhipicephalus microplus]|uniref:uncharacterized protein LOC142817378 isoform X2 n=1 Tax=Rhipicephalus microplus TaxID=6941 RepID=UPI003F6B04F6